MTKFISSENQIPKVKQEIMFLKLVGKNLINTQNENEALAKVVVTNGTVKSTYILVGRVGGNYNDPFDPWKDQQTFDKVTRQYTYAWKLVTEPQFDLYYHFLKTKNSSYKIQLKGELGL